MHRDGWSVRAAGTGGGDALGGRQTHGDPVLRLVSGGWAERLSWKEVAEVFQSSWDVVFGAVAMAVAYGREHLDLSGSSLLASTGWPGAGPSILDRGFRSTPTADGFCGWGRSVG